MRLLSILLLAALAFSLVGCAGLGNPENIAPYIELAAVAMPLFAPDLCDDTAPVMDDIQAAIDSAQRAKDNLVLACPDSAPDSEPSE